MKSTAAMFPLLLLLAGCATPPPRGADRSASSTADPRLDWFREARFGLFIHWGLYAIPAGQWGGATNHAEWIRTTARIPLTEYESLRERFNPVKFDADAWARMAADAGMRYVVITSKHHDGFCLFDSAHTDFDVMSTPFKRDVLKELSEACRRHGLRLCFYHSIMDWHHPDYLPRRDWEAADRPAAGAAYDRYVAYMKAQLRELLTNYGPIGILWFDGEWENTWTHERGVDLYHYVRGLQPDIIINNRVDTFREGMAGLSRDARAVGDYGTPEQEVPATGLPGVDWESCITMNDHWGWNKADRNWKSATALIRMLIDIASKGGNLLLNVGPTAEGEFPPEAVERLAAIGRWMKVNGESIYGTHASPLAALTWGRCTLATLPGGDTRLYLHVFDWPTNGRLPLPGLLNTPREARLLAQSGGRMIEITRDEDALVLHLTGEAPDPAASVVVLDLIGPPDVALPPLLTADADIFTDALDVIASTAQPNVELRYTLDGSRPTATSPALPPLKTRPDPRSPIAHHRTFGVANLTGTCDLSVRAFRGDRAVSPSTRRRFNKVTPLPAVSPPEPTRPGLEYAYFEGNWNHLPNFENLTPAASGVAPAVTLDPRRRPENFALRFRGFLRVERDGVYRFWLGSDDGSRMWVSDLFIDNNGLHGAKTVDGAAALAAGLHPVTIEFFQRSGDVLLEVEYAGPGLERRPIPPAALSH